MSHSLQHIFGICTFSGNQGPLQHSLSASSGSELPEMDCTNDQSAITRQSHAMHLQQQLIQGAQQQEDVGIKYEPELNRTLNPHYYDINKVLFDAHLQRLQRSQEN